MKYVVISGWKPEDEWNDWVIGIFDNPIEAIGKAYSSLEDLILNGYGEDPLRNQVTREDGKMDLEDAMFINSGKKVYITDLVAISVSQEIHDEAGYWIEIVERKHEEHNWEGGALEDLLSDYVRILTYNDEKGSD